MHVIQGRYKISHQPTHFVALGANLPGPDGACPRLMCERAIRAMAQLSRLRVQAISRWFSTAPIPACGQPRYVNGVARVSGEVAPAELLAILHDLERNAGRRRGERNAARPLDLDIIDMDGCLRDAPDPILPHPRAHLRAFVLLPLRDVAPDWVHPRLAMPINALIGRLEPQDIRPL